jgi:hypothetical protein
MRVQVKTRINLNNIKILNILFLIFDILINLLDAELEFEGIF